MEKLNIISNVVYAIIGACGALIPTLITIFNKLKAVRLAKTETEAEKAKGDLREKVVELVQTAEKTYEDVNNILKRNGKSAGALKKQTVLNSLQQYAFEKGYAFDKEYWDGKIEEVVALTKTVNAAINNTVA